MKSEITMPALVSLCWSTVYQHISQRVSLKGKRRKTNQKSLINMNIVCILVLLRKLIGNVIRRRTRAKY